MKPAVVVSPGTAGLGVIRALGSQGVPVVAVFSDRNALGLTSRYVSEAIQAPDPERHEPEFVERLRKEALRFEGALLIPCSDAAIGAISRHTGELEGSYVVGCPDGETARNVLQKNRTYEIAQSVGVLTPKTVVLRSLADAEHGAHISEYPCLVKPVVGHVYSRIFHRKMVLAKTPDELLRAYREATAAHCTVMLQEFIPGEDALGVNYNAYAVDGEAIVEFTAAKVRNAPPQIGSPRVVVSRHVPEVIESGRRLLRALRYTGFACTEFKRDQRDGRYRLMEVNARHNLSTSLAVRCGINFPWIEYRHRVENERPTPRDFEDGIFWIDLTRDLAYTLRHWHRERYSPRRYLEPYLRPHVFAELERGDARPILSRFAALGARLGARGNRRR